MMPREILQNVRPMVACRGATDEGSHGIHSMDTATRNSSASRSDASSNPLRIRRQHARPASRVATRRPVDFGSGSVDPRSTATVGAPLRDGRALFTYCAPVERLVPVPFGVSRDDECDRHFLARNRSSISANTWSTGFPRPGFFKASSARRSNSAHWSGVSSQSYPSSTILLQTSCASLIRSARPNFASISDFKDFHEKAPFGTGGAFQSLKPSMNSSQRRYASSTRSSKGSFFTATRNFLTDIDSIYSIEPPAQAVLCTGADSAFSLQPSAFA
jgi:hypothetical protein